MTKTNGEVRSLEELVRAGRKNEQRAFAELFERYRLYAWGVALRATSNQRVAEEAVVDGFASAFRSLDRLEEPLRFPSYLATCVRNEVLMTFRRTRDTTSTETLSSLRDEAQTPEEAFEATEDAQRAFRAYQRLDERQQRAIYLVDIEEVSTDAAAASFGLSPNSFRQLLFRARKSLRLNFIAPPLDDEAPVACRMCNDKLAAYLNATAPPRVAAMVNDHLAGCAECRERLEESKETRALLAGASGVVPSAVAMSLVRDHWFTSLAGTAARAKVLRFLKPAGGVSHLGLYVAGAVVVAASVTAAVVHVGQGPSVPAARATPTASWVPPRPPVPAVAPTTTSTTTAPAPTTTVPARTPVRSVAPTTTSTTSPPVPGIVLSSSLPIGGETVPYGGAVTGTVVASDPHPGEPGPRLTFDGQLPQGVQFTDDGTGTGSFSGIALSSGTYAGTVDASWGPGVAPSGEVAVAFVLAPARTPSFVSNWNAVATGGVAMSLVVTAVGAPAPTVSVDPTALPPGLSAVRSANGSMVISGVPTALAATENYPVPVTATNSAGTTSAVLLITVTA